ncbi:hypothetical protein [Achromobacter insolitus]|uniref:hypothetical protein n=1 Tax=Achromobacter insolitus TaxID=217204 RepID=UPI0027DFD88D|nr:hypothetical protein [Achromobacter insolitus]MDQ6216431.1 hypothetical protein [Achromobacter insolitus]
MLDAGAYQPLAFSANLVLKYDNFQQNYNKTSAEITEGLVVEVAGGCGRHFRLRCLRACPRAPMAPIGTASMARTNPMHGALRGESHAP